MNKLTVLVDMDDTLENLCATWVEYLNERHGTNVHIDDVKANTEHPWVSLCLLRQEDTLEEVANYIAKYLLV